MDFCGVRPAKIAKTWDRLGRSVAGRSRRVALVRAFGACDRATHFHTLCGVTFERSSTLHDRPGPSSAIALVSPAGSIKTVPPHRGKATGEFLGRPSLEAAQSSPDSDPIRWIGPRLRTDQPYRVTA
jgi:hypothetical protein